MTSISGSTNSDTRMPSPPQLLDGGPQMGMGADDVEPAFGGALLALFRHEAGRMRPQPRGEADHLGGRRHLEIERHEELPA